MSDMCHVILRCHRYIELTDDMHVWQIDLSE
jgi:hypothetical protein